MNKVKEHSVDRENERRKINVYVIDTCTCKCIYFNIISWFVHVGLHHVLVLTLTETYMKHTYSIQNMNGLDNIFSHFIFLNAMVALSSKLMRLSDLKLSCQIFR